MNNDRFKFRVWTDNGYINNGIALIGNTSHDTLIACQGNSIIEQCTGLRDKNGTLIYEGDIIEVENQDRDKHIVRWDDTDGSFCVRGYRLSQMNNIEIIGNIHENSGVAKNGN